MLSWLVFLPIIGGFLSWFCHVLTQRSFTNIRPFVAKTTKYSFLRNTLQKEWQNYGSVWIAVLTMLGTLIIALCFWHDAITAIHSGNVDWHEEINVDWIPLLGIRFHLMLDGFSIVMITLTIIIVIITLLYSRKENHNNAGLFYFCLLFMTSAVLTLFIAMDLFLFFFLWEAMAIPLYFLIALWGRRDSNAQLRFNGAGKFLIYIQVSSLLMLVSIISLALINWNLTNEWTFDYFVLTKTPISSYVEFLLMLGFLSAFIVRIPLVPFHSWFIDAHIESSTTGSMVISGLLLNTAIYGLLRFVIPMFSNTSLVIAPVILFFSLITLYYAAIQAFNQTDIKKLLAYVHIALMGFLTAIVYIGSLLSYQGLIIQIIAINLAIIGLFIISGLLVERYLTRNIKHFMGLKEHVKYLSTLTLFFILAILGIPGTANFVGSFMMLFGSYSELSYYAILLMLGLLLLSVSFIIRIQPIFYGTGDTPVFDKEPVSKLDLFLLIMILLILLIVGLFPQIILDTSYPFINQIQQHMSDAQTALTRGDV